MQGPLPTDRCCSARPFAPLSVISSLSGLRLGEVRAVEADEGTMRALHGLGELRRPQEQAEANGRIWVTTYRYLLRQAGLEG